MGPPPELSQFETGALSKTHRGCWLQPPFVGQATFARFGATIPSCVLHIMLYLSFRRLQQRPTTATGNKRSSLFIQGTGRMVIRGSIFLRFGGVFVAVYV